MEKQKEDSGSLLRRIREDRESFSLLLSLFSFSLFSSKRENICKPVPSFSTTKNRTNYNLLTSLLRSLPSISSLCDPKKFNPSLSDQQVDLLKFIFFSPPGETKEDNKPKSIVDVNCSSSPPIDIKRISVENYCQETGMKKNYFTQKSIAPSRIFKLIYADDNVNPSDTTNTNNHSIFLESVERYGSFYAFHGSPVENWHTILRFGLNKIYCKRSLYQTGIYLSTDLKVAKNFLNFAKHPPHFGCLLCCEVAKHPEEVFCGEDNSTIGAHNSNTLPKTYVVVAKNQLLRSRYLFVYDKPPSQSKFGIYMLLFYLVVVLIIVLSSTPSFKFFLRRYF